MTDKKKNKDYLSNKEMYAEIVRCQEEAEISDKLGRMFMLLARNYATKPNFNGYSYVDEMISSGILACVNAFMKFDPEKSNNPFSYFTRVIHNSFIYILNKERRSQEIRDVMLQENDMSPSSSYIERHKDDPVDS